PSPPRSTLFPYTTLFRSMNRNTMMFVVPNLPCGEARVLPHGHTKLPRKRTVTDEQRSHRPNWTQPRGRQFSVSGCTWQVPRGLQDRKSTRLNSSHDQISY